MRTFIDIGAMKGEEIDLALKSGFEIYAFEPNPNLKDYLLNKYTNNPNVSIEFVAAWNNDGKATLYGMANKEPGEDGVSLIKEKSNVGETGVLVDTIDIGRYLSGLDRDIDVLKINAEGAEYIILKSILDNFDYTRIKSLAIEDHSNYITDDSWMRKRDEVLERAYDLDIEIINWNNSKRYELLG